jgi:hypothetical protein
MPMLDPFSTDAFNLQSLVAAINILPNKYGLIESMGLMPIKGTRTRSILVEEKNGVLNLLKTKPVGSEGQKNDSARRVVRSFAVPHIPLDDVLLPSEYEGLRAFGQESVFAALASIVNEKLQSMKDKHDITLEYQRMGALKGVVYDEDLSVIYDFFKEFLIDKKSIDFVLGTAGTNVKNKCTEVRRHIEDNLKGAMMQGDPLVLCDSSFWDKFTSHTTVKAAFDRWESGAFLREDYRVQGFSFGGLRFKEYRGTATTHDGVTRKFIDTDYGITFPLGTTDVFTTIAAPADFIETTNTLGKPYYAKQEARKFNRGIDFHTQTNLLPMCKRPGVLVEVYTSN